MKDGARPLLEPPELHQVEALASGRKCDRWEPESDPDREEIQDRMAEQDCARGTNGHGPSEIKALRAELETTQMGPV